MTSASKSAKTHKKVYILIVAGVLVMVLCTAPIFLRCLRHPVRVFSPGTFKPPSSPDLTKCTRIEIQLLPHGSYEGNSLLNDEENRQRGNSFKSIMLVDPNEIKELANVVASAKYEVFDPKPIQAMDYIQINGYVDSKPRISFIIWRSELWLKHNKGFYIFRNPKFQFYFINKIRIEKLPFERRLYCAGNLRNLRHEMKLRKAIRDENKYPKAAEWCDAMQQYWQSKSDYPDRKSTLKWIFICFEKREGRCHYAMNPNCKTDSPADMVLLFETKDGWNQHGGSELFTFDNHDPKGGCVLLNDGTVKFIRTKEELQQLRWE